MAHFCDATMLAILRVFSFFSMIISLFGAYVFLDLNG